MIKDYLLKHKAIIITTLVLIASLLINVFAIRSCSKISDTNNHNVKALTDSIHYYKDKSGKLVATKLLLEGDLNTLRLANDSLYSVIKDMGLNHPTEVVYIDGEIVYEPQDTIWRTDTIIDNLNIRKNFAFDNEYRVLEGYVEANDSTIGLNIQKDQVYFDYTVAIEDSKVYIKSSNPYVKYKEISGVSIPQPKRKKWTLGVGPQIGYGYDFQNKHLGPFVGIGLSLNYNIVNW